MTSIPQLLQNDPRQTGSEVLRIPNYAQNLMAGSSSKDITFSAWIYVPEISPAMLPNTSQSIKTIAATKAGGCGNRDDNSKGWSFFVNEWNTLNRQLRLNWTNVHSACEGRRLYWEIPEVEVLIFNFKERMIIQKESSNKGAEFILTQKQTPRHRAARARGSDPLQSVDASWFLPRRKIRRPFYWEC
jgi:hypothetical protein